jgi:hypothetical protein
VSFEADLRALLRELSFQASNAVLVLDLGALHVEDSEGLAELLVDRINELPFVHEWLVLAVALTSFPEKLAVEAGQTKNFRRNDWQVYEQLKAKRENLLRMPIFGNYAVEYPTFNETARFAPTAHFRYSTGQDYLIVKGKSTRKPNGYDAIFPVADSLVANPEFRGQTFSEGDAFIDYLARHHKETGNASSWRWAATDHHLTLITKALGAPSAEEVDEAEVFDASDTQMALF